MSRYLAELSARRTDRVIERGKCTGSRYWGERRQVRPRFHAKLPRRVQGPSRDEAARREAARRYGSGTTGIKRACREDFRALAAGQSHSSSAFHVQQRNSAS